MTHLKRFLIFHNSTLSYRSFWGAAMYTTLGSCCWHTFGGVAGKDFPVMRGSHLVAKNIRGARESLWWKELLARGPGLNIYFHNYQDNISICVIDKYANNPRKYFNYRGFVVCAGKLNYSNHLWYWIVLLLLLLIPPYRVDNHHFHQSAATPAADNCLSIIPQVDVYCSRHPSSDQNECKHTHTHT